MAGGLAVNRMGEFGRIGAQEVMAGVPGGLVLGEQAGPGQFTESDAGLCPGHPGQTRGGRQRYVRTDMQAEQAEHRGGRRAETAVGPGQHGTDAGGLVAGVERVQRVVVPELIGQRGKRDAAACGRASRGDGQGERQPGAQRDHPGGRFRFVVDAPAAEPAGQQCQRFGFRQNVQVKQAGSVGGREPCHLPSTGDHRHAGRAAWQQRPHLLLVLGIVEDHENPAAGEQAAKQRCLGVHVLRYGIRS